MGSAFPFARWGRVPYGVFFLNCVYHYGIITENGAGKGALAFRPGITNLIVHP
jgi:hypothetical protein